MLIINFSGAGDIYYFQLPFPSLLTHYSDKVPEKRHSPTDEYAALSDVKLCVYCFHLYWPFTGIFFPVSWFVADPAGSREIISSRLLPMRGLQRVSGWCAVHCRL